MLVLKFLWKNKGPKIAKILLKETKWSYIIMIYYRIIKINSVELAHRLNKKYWLVEWRDDFQTQVHVVLHMTLQILRKGGELFNAWSEETGYLNRKGSIQVPVIKVNLKYNHIFFWRLSHASLFPFSCTGCSSRAWIQYSVPKEQSRAVVPGNT